MTVKNLSILIIIFLFSRVTAMDTDIPVSVQIPLFFKILSMERNIMSHPDRQLNYLLIYQKDFRASLNIKNEFMEFIDKCSINKWENRPVRFTAIVVNSPEDLRAWLDKSTADVVYVAPLRAIDIGKISELLHSKKIISFSSKPELVEQGYFSVSVDIRGEKPVPVINLANARQEGADFSSQLLKLSKVIK